MSILSCVNLSKLFFLRWVQKFSYNLKLFKRLVRISCIIILAFWYVFVFILPIVYLGVIFTRKRYIQRLYIWIVKKNIIIEIFLFFIVFLILFILVCMIFPVFIFILMFIGYLFESGKLKLKRGNNKKVKLGFISNKEPNKQVVIKVSLPLKKGYLNEKV